MKKHIVDFKMLIRSSIVIVLLVSISISLLLYLASIAIVFFVGEDIAIPLMYFFSYLNIYIVTPLALIYIVISRPGIITINFDAKTISFTKFYFFKFLPEIKIPLKRKVIEFDDGFNITMHQETHEEGAIKGHVIIKMEKKGKQNKTYLWGEKKFVELINSIEKLSLSRSSLISIENEATTEKETPQKSAPTE